MATLLEERFKGIRALEIMAAMSTVIMRTYLALSRLYFLVIILLEELKVPRCKRQNRYFQYIILQYVPTNIHNVSGDSKIK